MSATLRSRRGNQRQVIVNSAAAGEKRNTRVVPEGFVSPQESQALQDSSDTKSKLETSGTHVQIYIFNFFISFSLFCRKQKREYHLPAKLNSDLF